MDDEAREALEMTKDELLERAARGTPARVAREKPRRIKNRGQEAGQVFVVAEWDVRSFVVEDAEIGDVGPKSFAVEEAASLSVSP